MLEKLQKALENHTVVKLFTILDEEFTGYITAIEDEFVDMVYLDYVRKAYTGDETDEEFFNDEGDDTIFVETTVLKEEIRRLDSGVTHQFSLNTAMFVKHFGDNQLSNLIKKSVPKKKIAKARRTEIRKKASTKEVQPENK